MWPARVSNPGPLTYESGALPILFRLQNDLKSLSLTAGLHAAPVQEAWCLATISKACSAGNIAQMAALRIMKNRFEIKYGYDCLQETMHDVCICFCIPTTYLHKTL